MDPHSRSFNPNRHLKEQFVSNLEGSSIIEIAALATIIPALFVLRHWMSFGILTDSLHATKAPSKKNNDAIVGCRDWRVYVTALTLDFLVIVLPMLLFVTVLADWAQRCALCLILLFLALVAIKRIDFSSSYGEKGPQDAYSVRTSISAYRVFVMVLTCLCILAVDFEIFPRRYAKTETYGTSLMDIGVGSFVLANALVSRQARNVSSMKCKTMLQSTSPLIILGFGRLIFTSGVDYQVHVGEYGVHWNFFFTLAAVAILTSAVNIHPQYCGILGVMILLGYQIWLVSGLNAYLLSTERTGSLINQNKEGIFSIIGYWGMYLVGVQFGSYLFYEDGPIPKMRNNRWTRSRIWILCAVFWLLTVILDKHVERVSRRTCNLVYVTFILALNFQALAILMISDIFPGNKNLVLEKAFNQNLLAMFLLANVLTGLINLSVDTISASSVTALLILVGYAFVLCVFAGFIEFLGIRLKFW